MPYERGRILFWHGPPGTGKTTAIRSLIRAWKDSMQAEVIADPEHFFSDMEYLSDVLFREQSNAQGRGRLVIAEDAGDLLLASSRAERGHLMARLLNLSDGLLGQGLRVVFLLTTNEDVTEVDPAFLRPGRCLQSLEFPRLTRSQAADWLAAKGHNHSPHPGGGALADLYALLRDRVPRKSTLGGQIGFTPGAALRSK